MVGARAWTVEYGEQRDKSFSKGDPYLMKELFLQGTLGHPQVDCVVQEVIQVSNRTSLDKLLPTMSRAAMLPIVIGPGASVNR